jgi:hypothetical protein
MKPFRLILRSIILCCLYSANLSLDAVAANRSTERLTSSNDTGRSSIPVLIASNEVRLKEIISEFKESLESLFQLYDLDNTKSWGLSISGDIGTEIRDGTGHVSLPNVMVYVNWDDMKAKIKFGEIKFNIAIDTQETAIISLEIQKNIPVAKIDGANDVGKLIVDLSEASATWNFDLQTIVDHKVAIKDFQLISNESTGSQRNMVTTDLISSAGRFTKKDTGRWAGRVGWRVEGISAFDIVRLDEGEAIHVVEDIDLTKYARVIGNSEESWMLGSWFYGGTVTPTNIIQEIIDGGSVDIFRTMEQASKLNRKGKVSTELNSISVSSLSVEKFSYREDYFSKVGDYISEAHLKINGITSSDNEKNSEFVPSELAFRAESRFNELPNIWRVIGDLESADPGLLASLRNGSSKSEKLQKLKPIFDAIVDAGAKIRLTDAVLNGQPYAAMMSGQIEMSENLNAGISLKLHFDVEYDNPLFELFSQLAGGNEASFAKVIVDEIINTRRPLNGHRFRSQLIFEIDDQGQFRINGRRIGDKILLFKPKLSGGLDHQHRSRPVEKSMEKDDMTERLTVLKGLLDQGLISETEATAKRKEILGGL